MDCIIIGSGVAGLLAARELNSKGMTTVILDKARGVGGRMATRRIGEAVFDHGAQFFTARDPRFQALVAEWIAVHAAREWGHGFASGDGFLAPDGFPRYCGAAGMTAIPKYLAEGLEVRLGDGVTSASPSNGGWEVRTGTGMTFRGGRLLLTAPVPQSLEILTGNEASLPPDAVSALAGIAYDPCFAVMVTLDGPSKIPAPGGVRMPHDLIAWMADNYAKGISSAKHGVTIHANPNFSRQYFDEDTKLVTEMLLGAAEPWLGAKVVDMQIHQWQYSQPTRIHPAPCIYTEQPAPLAFAGDAFGGLRVEGAALSGLSAAEHLA
jgi:hypothetical protein